jgi:hypothetical protein
MCRIHKDFKRFRAADRKDSRHHGKASSIMQANVLSIMPAEAAPVTSG